MTPEMTGALAKDLAALTASARETDDLIAGLPAKPERGPDARRAAERALDATRRLRLAFMTTHAARVYATLTDDFTLHPRLDELARTAAEAFPGLTPAEEQMAAERSRAQAAKEGRAIDHGIFFHALLRDPRIGEHICASMLRPTEAALRALPDFQRTGRADLGVVTVERDGTAAFLTVHNLRYLNAEDDPLAVAMETAVDLALLDDGVRVCVLRGAPMTHPAYRDRRVFNAGINLTHLHEGRISYVGFLLGREFGYLNKFTHGLLAEDRSPWPHSTVQKPWIAAVDSFAIGGGMQVLLAVDRVVAGRDAYFSLPAAQEGIIPGAGTFRLGRLFGGRLSRQVLLGGRVIHAAEPEAALLCDEVTDDLDGAVARGVEQLDSEAVVANKRMLTLVEEPLDDFRRYMADFALAQSLRIHSDDVLGKLAARAARRRGSAPAG